MIGNQRLQKILELLIENKAVITGEFLCNNLGVSSRTIRSDIKELNKILEKNGAVILSERARGYKLNVIDEEVFRVLVDEDKSTYDNSSVIGRTDNIISKLLVSKINNIEGITQIELADELFVSLSSLKNDMKLVKDVLDEYHLNIEKVSNKGVSLCDKEEELRACIKKYMIINDEVNKVIKIKLQNILNNHSELEINQIVKSNVLSFDFKLSDKAMNDIISLIKIMLVRNASKNNVSYTEEERKKLSESFRYKIVKAICYEINETYNVKINSEEMFYLTKYMVASSSILVKSNENIAKCKEFELVDKIMFYIKREFNINFLEDKVLVEFLVNHLMASIYRAKYGIVVENSMLNAIKNNYPFALELAIYSNEIIKDSIRCDLSEDDIGFIALHFAAALERLDGFTGDKKKNAIIVCGTGMGTSLLLKVKLEVKFKDRINIIDTIPTYEFSNDMLESNDLIISTVPLGVDDDKVIYVKSLLDKEEINLIDNKLKGRHNKSNILVNKFKEELFFREVEGEGRYEVLNLISQQILRKSYISESVIESVFKRENLASTEIGDLVAIPHVMSEEIKESFIAVGILKRAITWNKEKVQVVFFLGISENDREEWKGYLEQIYKNIIDSNVIKKIIKCQSFDDLKNVISDF